MSQEQPNKEEKKFPGFNPNRKGEENKKGPKFSIYWVYAIIFAVLVVLAAIKVFIVKG